MGKDVKRKGIVDGLLFFAYTHTHTNNTKYSILMDLSINNTMYYFPYLFTYYQGIALDI